MIAFYKVVFSIFESMKRLLIIILIFISTFNGLWAQNVVLDAPFILSKASMFVQEPVNLNDNYEYNAFPGEEREMLMKELPLYQSSFLYAELEYTRVRVYRTVLFKENKSFSNVIKNTLWVNNNGDWTAYDGFKKTKKVEFKEEYKINRELEWWVRQFLGVNVKEIQNDTNIYSRGKSRLNLFKDRLDSAIKYHYVRIDDEGILRVGKDYAPTTGFEIISFSKLIKESIVKGNVSAYNDANFYNFLTIEESKKTLENNGIIGFKLKEDYFIDILTGKLTSAIIGVGLINENKKEVLWMYYPELRWAIWDKCTVVSNEIVNYEYLLDKHIFNYKIDSLEELPSYSYSYQSKYKNDYEFSVKLDPLMAIAIQKETESFNKKFTGEISTKNSLHQLKANYVNGIANGKIIEYHPNGKKSFAGIMKNGKCEGLFKFYYENGKLKANRNFKNGVLEGEQVSCYDNGKVYANYLIKEGSMQSLKRNYEDGSLMEEGSFEHGIMIGEWNYNIKCSQGVWNIVKRKNKEGLIYTYTNGGFFYSVNYTHKKKQHCPANFYNGLVEQVCLGFEYVKH